MTTELSASAPPGSVHVAPSSSPAQGVNPLLIKYQQEALEAQRRGQRQGQLVAQGNDECDTCCAWLVTTLGMFMAMAGFITLMVGSFAEPIGTEGSALREQEEDSLESAKVAGAVLFPIGVLLAVCGGWRACRSGSQRCILSEGCRPAGTIIFGLFLSLAFLGGLICVILGLTLEPSPTHSEAEQQDEIDDIGAAGWIVFSMSIALCGVFKYLHRELRDNNYGQIEVAGAGAGAGAGTAAARAHAIAAATSGGTQRRESLLDRMHRQQQQAVVHGAGGSAASHAMGPGAGAARGPGTGAGAGRGPGTGAGTNFAPSAPSYGAGGTPVERPPAYGAGANPRARWGPGGEPVEGAVEGAPSRYGVPVRGVPRNDDAPPPYVGP